MHPHDLARDLATQVDRMLRAADAESLSRFPGDAGGRQPVHTVYVPGDVYSGDLVQRWGAEARQSFATHEGLLAELLGASALDGTVLARVASKLDREPVEDLRIDFEDGYGHRGEEQEDLDVEAAARALARSQADGTAPPFVGIRFKSFDPATRARGLRTLVSFVSVLLEAGGTLGGFVTTFPKVTSVDQVLAMVRACERLEQELGLAPGTLRFEIQVETPQSVLGPDGTALVARMIHAADGRVTALHYGTYDYSAFCGIAAPYQSLEHPVADHAKAVMQAAAAGTGVRLSDGSTNVLPLGTDQDVRSAYELHLRLVRRSLERGYYQGWDLHAAQLPSRFAATYGFYRDNFAAAAGRLRDYLRSSGGHVLDEPATARALADLLLRGVDCGALDAEEVAGAAGTDVPALLGLARPGGRS